MRPLGGALVVVGALVAVWGIDLFAKAAGGGGDVTPGTLVALGVLLVLGGAVLVGVGVVLARGRP